MSTSLGVALSWLCCLPFAAALGAGVTAAAAALTPFQPYLALASVSLLAVTFVQTLKADPCDEIESCRLPSKRRQWIFLGAVTVATVLLITVPYWGAQLIYWTL